MPVVNMADYLIQTMRISFLFILIIASFGDRSLGAEIRIVEEKDNLSTVIISGDINFEDSAVFNNITSKVSKAIVAFNSDGGSLDAGINIGLTIRLKGFVTAVPNGSRCASACALAWLGGSTRFMGADSQVGFHSASLRSGDQLNESSSGNAILGAYLNRLGLPDRAVAFIAEASPQQINWLTFGEARALGIDVAELSKSDSSKQQQRPNQSPSPLAQPLADAINDEGIIRVQSGWSVIEKRMYDKTYFVFRKYSFSENGFINSIIYNCSKYESKPFSNIDFIIPKSFRIKSFSRDSWIAKMPIRVLIDGKDSFNAVAEYNRGEIFLDRSPQFTDVFDAIMHSDRLDIQFGDLNDVISYAMTEKMDDFMSNVKDKKIMPEMTGVRLFTRADASRLCSNYQK